MKPSLKSSLPSAILLFLAGALLLNMIESFIQNRRQEYSGPRLWLSAGTFSADGRVIYVASYYDRRTGTSGWKEFDETLASWKEGRSLRPGEAGAPPQPYPTVLTHAGVEEAAAFAKWVSPVAFQASTRLSTWWNGPQGRLEFFDLSSRRHVLSMGGDGVPVPAAQRPATPLRLSSMGNGWDIICTPDAVYRLERSFTPSHTPTPKLAPLFRGPVDAVGYLNLQPTLDSKEKDRHLAERLLVAGSGFLHILNGNGKELRQVPIPPETQGQYLSVALLEQDRLCLTMRKTGELQWPVLFLLAPDGAVLRRFQIDEQEVTQRMNSLPDGRLLWAPTILPPIPHYMTTAALIQSAALSAVLAGVVVWLQRRRGARGWRRVSWPAFAFVFGLLGLATYLAAHWDERLEKCPGCGRRRPVTLDACPHCAAPWPRPAPLGIEVVEA